MADRTADEAEIYALIQRVRAAIAARDVAALEELYVHAPYTARWYASRVAGLSVYQGWDELFPRMRRALEDPTIASPPSTTGEILDLNIRVDGDLGWVSFQRRYPGVPEHRAGPEPAYHIRIVERHEGRWRIAVTAFLDPGPGTADIATIRLDPDGTVVWMDPAAERQLENDDEVVVRAGRLRFRNNAANTRLQAALRWAEAQDRGIATRRGAMPIVLDVGLGTPARVWWVVADSGAIYFTFPSTAGHAQRLDAAAAAYGLSPAQRIVAGHIVDGLALPEIAKAMKVRPNTVRTHLDRIFEKTGVRNQTALVRVLLSAASPF